MKTLALEFSSAQRSVAVVVDGEIRATAAQVATRETPAFGLIVRVLAEARLEREQIECVAIGLGPGSYTGIRAAIALAQGWQLARSIKLIGISSLDCLAAEAQTKGVLGRINMVVDAQRNELYLATYELTSAGFRESEPLRLAAIEEVRSRITLGEEVIGPEVHRWFPEGRVLFPDAATLGQLAARRSDFAPGEALEPIYLRPISFVKAPPARVPPAG
jgi:tRNA threonylcarbamoyl adenosine modification protein YeaZ